MKTLNAITLTNTNRFPDIHNKSIRCWLPISSHLVSPCFRRVAIDEKLPLPRGAAITSLDYFIVLIA